MLTIVLKILPFSWSREYPEQMLYIWLWVWYLAEKVP